MKFLRLAHVMSLMVWLSSVQCKRAESTAEPTTKSAEPAGMVKIEGGEFLMGSDEPYSQVNERPAVKVRVGGF
ncbi:MAG: hypothetical protein ACO3RK_07820, partial [Luteolibacter sp.]